MSLLILFLEGGDPLQKKAHASVISNWIGMKCGGIVLHVNTHRLMQSDFSYTFKMAAMTSCHAEKCFSLVSAHAVTILSLLLHMQCSPATTQLVLIVYRCIRLVMC